MSYRRSGRAEGHRERLRQRLLEEDVGSLVDSEILEMLLFLSEPRRDVRPLVHDLLTRFKNLSGVLTASEAELNDVGKLRQNTFKVLQFPSIALARLAEPTVQINTVFEETRDLESYFERSLFYISERSQRLLLLNSRNKLLNDIAINVEEEEEGVLDRAIVSAILENHASACFFIDVFRPGYPFKDMDRRAQSAYSMKKSAALVGATLHDYIVISGADVFSLREMVGWT